MTDLPTAIMLRVRRGGLAAIGLIAGLLAACTGGGPARTPSATPTPVTSSPTTSAPATGTSTPSEPLTTGANVRPGEKPPVFPELAKQHTANGALAFAAYYFKAFDWSYATNDPFLLRGLALPTCRGCANTIRVLERLDEERATLAGGRISLLSAEIDHHRYQLPADYVVDVTLDEQATVIHRRSSAPSTVAAGVRAHHSLVFLRWVRRQWRVADIAGR